MMWTDITDLQNFYHNPLGRVVGSVLQQRVQTFWPDMRGKVLVGLGYALPCLTPFVGDAARIFALMPARQGIIRWPAEGANRSVMVEEDGLPFPDYAIDRMILLHMLEQTDSLYPLMQEVWRVVPGDGRLLLIAASRHSIWSRREITPFSTGKPWTVGQIRLLLRETGFTPVRVEHALHTPPFENPVLLRSAPMWERLGARWLSHTGGLLLVEAQKTVMPAATARQRTPWRTPVILPATTPATARIISLFNKETTP